MATGLFGMIGPPVQLLVEEMLRLGVMTALIRLQSMTVCHALGMQPRRDTATQTHAQVCKH